MKKLFLVTLVLTMLIGGSVLLLNDESNSKKFPKPTTMVKHGDEEGNQDKRAEWLELMHQAAPDTDWKAIELQNSQTRHRKRVQARLQNVNQRDGSEEEIVPGVLTGTWKERGSRNQAGSVLVTEYDQDADRVYVVSGGGTLWRGTLDDNNWEVINQDLQFNGQLLKFIDGPNGRRLIAQSGRVPHYSDDDGQTWTASTGINFNDNWGGTRHPVVLNDSLQTIYLFAKPDYWSNAVLYKSTDQGESFSNIITFNQSDFNAYAICNPYGTNDVYLLSRSQTSTTIYLVNQSTNQLDLVNTSTDFVIGDDRAQLIGTQLDSTVRFYSHNVDNQVFQSEDFGATWSFNGNVPENPWGVGMYVLPSNPDVLITGGVNCYRSYDAGQNWSLMNEWWEYYGDEETKLHADMMYFKEFENSNGDPFILISNHGGLNISWDEMGTVFNIGKNGLNVGQFYDVSSDPTDSRYVFAGTQDQGFQRGFTEDANEIMEFEQVISGDYGHTVFTGNGTSLWTVYPGGWISFYDDPRNGYLTADWEVNSDNESVWIPPLMADPSPSLHKVYLAGGNMNGGSGSHLIGLQYQFGNINVSQLPFDFFAESGAAVSTLAHSSINTERWYAATANGRFFVSNNSGMDWEQTLNYVPEGHYLYGASIYPSKSNDSTIYYAGSGYSNPPVYKSTDNGLSFVAMNNGLPSTLVFEIVGNEDESLLFAATEAGPYVFVTAEEQWYDLSGLCAPTQTYWSVEYLEEEKIARFGTYGRGLWDFQIEEQPVSTKELKLVHEKLNVFPNPSNGAINIELPVFESTTASIKVFSSMGQLVFSESFTKNNIEKQLIQTDLKHLAKGNYIVIFEADDLRLNQSIVLN